MADFIADYWERIESFPVLSQRKPGDILAAIPLHAPQRGLGDAPESWDAIFADIEKTILPGITHWQHPNFYAYFSANISGPAVLAEMLSAGLGVQGMLWATSPACTELEQRMMDWLGDAIGLPPKFLFSSRRRGGSAGSGGSGGGGGGGGGVIEGTASESTLAAMLAARDRVRRGGAKGQYVAYASNQAHSSVVKAAMIAGLANGPDDRTAVRLIDVDDGFRLRPAALANAIREDIEAGRVPFYVCATIGTTGVTAVDPIADIASVLAAANAPYPIWLHIDAAHSGASLICAEHRWQIKGIEGADSFAFNPHKWLLTNFDCGCFWTADAAALTRALSVTPEYLRNAASDSGDVIDYRDWQIPLGRRFRALKLWFVMRHYGIDGLQAHIRRHVALAQLFEQLVNDDPRFQLAAPRTVNLVCFRLRNASDAANKQLMDTLNATGKAYLTHTVLPRQANAPHGSLVLRMAISGTLTMEHHVRETWALIQLTAASIIPIESSR